MLIKRKTKQKENKPKVKLLQLNWISPADVFGAVWPKPWTWITGVGRSSGLVSYYLCSLTLKPSGHLSKPCVLSCELRIIMMPNQVPIIIP
jgi:hypothetical protein